MAVEWYGDELLAKARKAALQAVTRGAFSVKTEAESLILDTPKSGRIYRRRGVEHQASAPGEPFASDTGATIQSGKVDLKPTELAADINWSTAYASALEYGTEGMGARSFARPALSNKAPEIHEDVQKSVAEAFK